ncbi:hypothetical protein DXG01_001055 [Tephrocybe rancida]|nr:hypothetical protein DXG01_001055 [Tephrocybe rancida]
MQTGMAVEVTASLDLDFDAAHPNEPFWLEAIKHQGSSAYNSDPTYQVFRNVKDFGAKGDGIADDTLAIKHLDGEWKVRTSSVHYECRIQKHRLYSGGFMGDLTFNGGKFGLWVGNQQSVILPVVHLSYIIGTGGVSAVSIVDAVIRDTPIAVRSAAASNTTLAGSVVLDNMRLKNVTTAVADGSNTSVLGGGASLTIKSWVQGNVFTGASSTGIFTQGPVPSVKKPAILLDRSGRVFGKTHPQYTDYSVRHFVSVKDHGARGDGHADDTAALQSLLYKSAGRKIVFFDAGTYIVTSTLTVPPGTRMVGEAWSVIAGKGKVFSNQDQPRVVVRVGEKYSCGVVEITDMIFTTVGPVLLLDMELIPGSPGWVEVRISLLKSQARLANIDHAPAAGTELELANCPPGATDTAPCMAAYLALHLTHGSSAYLEYRIESSWSQGTWVWLADHDLDGDGASQISIYSGRGVLSESEGPVWMIGTAEHHVMYQYRLVHARNHYMGLIQTESPYWQPVPAAPEPFAVDRAFKDPEFKESDVSAWALSVEASKNIIVFDIDSDSSVTIYSLSTVASTFQISVDGAGVINQTNNLNGFASTVTLWTSSGQTFTGVEVEVGIQL